MAFTVSVNFMLEHSDFQGSGCKLTTLDPFPFPLAPNSHTSSLVVECIWPSFKAQSQSPFSMVSLTTMETLQHMHCIVLLGHSFTIFFARFFLSFSAGHGPYIQGGSDSNVRNGQAQSIQNHECFKGGWP